jgi:CHAD domain-containing protein
MTAKYKAALATDDGHEAAFCRCGVQALLKQLRTLRREMAGVRQNADIECVHRMRVASRRLRSVLPLFADCLPPKRARTWRKQLRRVTRPLGAARDTDVQIAFVQHFMQECQDESVRPGVARLLLRLQQQRQHLQPPVVKALDWLTAHRWVETVMHTVRQGSKQIRSSESTTLPLQTYQQIQQVITGRLNALLDSAAAVQGPSAQTELHALRIAVKRLRYTMEAFEPLYHEAFTTPLHTARTLQDLLGDLHDCDVWLDTLPRFVEKERARTIEYFGAAESFAALEPGLLALEENRRQHRAQCYQAFDTFWRKVQTHNVWEQLRRTLAAPLVSVSSNGHAVTDAPSAALLVSPEDTIGSEDVSPFAILQPLEARLRASPGAWQWHAATRIAEIPSGHLINYKRFADWVNATCALRINASNVAWLRRSLYAALGRNTSLPLHRLAKAGDVHSRHDSADLKVHHDTRRAAEGILTTPVWWQPDSVRHSHA